jgi:DtxR family Mn-dependent transcriptional regulator
MSEGVLSASLEDYLEAIFHLVEEERVARVRDIAARMNVQMPSVTGALHSLAARELVNYDPYSYVTLTPRGEVVAREVVRRHTVLTHFLTGFLGLDRETAERNACHMEHAIEPVVLQRLVEFVERREAARSPAETDSGEGGR